MKKEPHYRIVVQSPYWCAVRDDTLLSRNLSEGAAQDTIDEYRKRDAIARGEQPAEGQGGEKGDGT